jgi:hypothetical protein
MTRTFCIVGALAAVAAIACSDQAPKSSLRADTPVVDCFGEPRVSPASATLHIGDTLRLSYSLSCTTTLTAHRWSSSRDTVATVDSAGLVRGVSGGIVTIIATAVADPSVRGAAAITVVP